MWLQEMMLGCDTELFETVRKAWRRQKGGLGFSALNQVGEWEERIRPVLCSWRKRPQLATQVLCALRSAKRPRAASLVLQAMAASRLTPNDLHLNAALSVNERCSDWSRALWQLGQASNLGIQSNTVSFNTTISACAKSYHWQWSMHLHHEMEQQKVLKDIISYSAGISACEKVGQWRLALQLFEEIHLHRVRNDVIGYGAAISACEKGAAWEQALALYRCCLEEGVRCDSVIYSACISAFEKGAQWQRALGFLPLASASPACEKAARWQMALELLQVFPGKGSEVDVAISAAISACGRATAWQNTLALLHSKRVGTRDAVACNAAINACGNAARWWWSLHLFEEMGKGQLQRDQISFNAAVDAVGGDWSKAVELYRMMQCSLVTPDIITFNALLQGCATAMILGMVDGNLITEAVVCKLGLNLRLLASRPRPRDSLLLALAAGRSVSFGPLRARVGGSLQMTPRPYDKDYYQVLGVHRDVSDGDLTKAYRKLVLKYHPDKSQDHSSGEAFKRITQAYNVLHDPDQRRCYDRLQLDVRSTFRGQPGMNGSHGAYGSASDSEDMAIYRAVHLSDDAQPKRYKPGATEMLKPCTVPKNTTVVLHGFKKTVQHNGREAKVRGFDQRTGLYNLVMEGCCTFGVKPENMTQKCLAKIHGLNLHSQFNGKSVKIVGFDDAGRYLVMQNNGATLLTLKPANVILDVGTCVRIQGSQEELNGKMAVICEVYQDAGEYLMECADGQHIYVKYENVVC
eukprot:symbB.v1.2.018690.t1/scaffold1410.1/size216244/16